MDNNNNNRLFQRDFCLKQQFCLWDRVSIVAIIIINNNKQLLDSVLIKVEVRVDNPYRDIDYSGPNLIIVLLYIEQKENGMHVS